jgi:hypothetical protein
MNIYNHLLSHNLLKPFQSGFVPGASTVNQLTYLYNFFTEAFDSGKEVRAVFCDISKAFDRVWHKGLLYKLRRFGIKGNLIGWFSSYLSNRKQRVVVPGAHQGGILSEQVYLKGPSWVPLFSHFYQ